MVLQQLPVSCFINSSALRLFTTLLLKACSQLDV